MLTRVFVDFSWGFLIIFAFFDMICFDFGRPKPTLRRGVPFANRFCAIFWKGLHNEFVLFRAGFEIQKIYDFRKFGFGWKSLVDLLWLRRGNGNENNGFHMVLALKSQGGWWWNCCGFGMEIAMKTMVFIWFWHWNRKGVGGGFVMFSLCFLYVSFDFRVFQK